MCKGMNTNGKELWKRRFERSELKLKDIKERDVGKYSMQVLQRCELISPGVKRVDPSSIKGCTSYVALLRPVLM